MPGRRPPDGHDVPIDGELHDSAMCASGCEEALEKRTVALEGGMQVVGRDIVTPVPLAL
jgi:hypothetical protein